MSPLSMIKNGYRRVGKNYIAVRRWDESTGWKVAIVRDTNGKLIKHVINPVTLPQITV